MTFKSHLIRPLIISAVITFILMSGIITRAEDRADPTTFLPLKVHALSDKEKLAEKFDQIIGNSISGRNMTMIERDTTFKAIAVSAWPPPMTSIAPLLPEGYRGNVVVGSITRLGNILSLDLAVHDLSDPAATSHFFKEIKADDDPASALTEMIDQIDAFSTRHQFIAAITVTGNRRIDTGAIRRKIESRPGDLYKVTALRQDLKNVFSMGYFTDIQISSEETQKGHEVTFQVIEKDIVSKVKIAGNDNLDEDSIREVIKIKSSSLVNDEQIRESIANIRNLYREDGYFSCQVKVEQVSSRKDRVDLIFQIEEGEKIYIKDIIFTGNKAFSDRQIRKSIITTKKGWFSFISDSGLLNKEKLSMDAARLTAFYHNNGFVEAKVGEPEVIKKDSWLYVYFNIEERQRYVCGSVELSGDLIEEEAILKELVKIDEEEFFNRTVLRQDVLRITDFYAEKGYAFADVIPSTAKNPAERTVDLNFRINKGPLVRIDRISIKGNTRTRDKIIRREIMLKEGGLFNAEELKESNQRLARIDFFEDVNISPEPGIDDTLMNLSVEVKEKPTGTFSVGAGYSTVEKMTFMGEISENNLMGRGQRLAANVHLSSTATKFKIDFTEPHIFDSQVLLGTSLYNWEREYDEYTKDSVGFTIRLGYPLWELWNLSTSYGYDDTMLLDVGPFASQEILDSMNFHVTSYIQLGVSRDTRNRMYGATDGSSNLLTIKYAGGGLGGDNSFTKTEATTGWYFPITENTAFHPKLTGGFLVGNSKGHLPVYEKFYLGGLSSIRSFDYGEISPRDPNFPFDRIGGTKMWYSNFEYVFPIAKNQGLTGVIFYDIGNVYGTDEGWNFSEYKHAAGAGFRWMSPIGPLRLEWAKNLDPVGFEKPDGWEFSIGGMF
jgi:outer membrane protein insertion porin family